MAGRRFSDSPLITLAAARDLRSVGGYSFPSVKTVPYAWHRGWCRRPSLYYSRNRGGTYTEYFPDTQPTGP
jgi:hypothetical protein